MSQDCIHDTHRRAPGEALDVDGATGVKIWVGSRLQNQPEARQVVIGCANVQRADHQGGKRPGRWAGGPRDQMVIYIHISAIPEERK